MRTSAEAVTKIETELKGMLERAEERGARRERAKTCAAEESLARAEAARQAAEQRRVTGAQPIRAPPPPPH